MTALLPLHTLNQFSAAPFGWLVPGLFEERVGALIRTLPKPLRVHFVPVPEYAARVIPMLDMGQGSLLVQLAGALARTGGVNVSADAFREDLLPVHLRMNLALVDDNERVIDRSRNLAQLQARHGVQAKRNFQQLAQQALLHTGERSWNFGDLPLIFDAQHDGQRLYGHPALVDEGETVGVRVFATPVEAHTSQTRGLTRLLRLVMARDLKPLRRDLPVSVQTELAYRNLGGANRDLRDDLLDRATAAACLEGREDLRTAAALEQRVTQCRAGVAALAQDIGRAVQQGLLTLIAVELQLKAATAATREDVRAQLARLLPAAFVATTPWSRLRELPRYLKAVQYRLEKATQDPTRDAKLANEVRAVEARYWQAVAAEQGIRAPVEDPFRWLIEEYRVSLFAQQLKTPVPVSAKRLADAWQERSR